MNTRGIPLQLPQNCIVADRHPEPSHQTFAGAATRAMTKQADNLRDPRCPARIRGSNRRQTVGERLTFTFLLGAPPAAQQELHVTALPWTGRFWRLRLDQPCRFRLRWPQSGQMPIAGPAAETTQLSSSVSATPRTLTPEPGDHFVFVRMPVHSGIFANSE